MSDNTIHIARCQFWYPCAPDDTDGSGPGVQCPNMGRQLLLREPLGRLALRTLCREHSDWVEVDESEVTFG